MQCEICKHRECVGCNLGSSNNNIIYVGYKKLCSAKFRNKCKKMYYILRNCILISIFKH